MMVCVCVGGGALCRLSIYKMTMSHASCRLFKGRRQNSLSVTTNKPQRMTNVGD